MDSLVIEKMSTHPQFPKDKFTNEPPTYLPEGYLPTQNITTGRRQCPFVLPTTFPTGCTENVCHGSIMEKYGTPCGDVDQTPEDITREAVEYLAEYYKEQQFPESERDARIASVRKSIQNTGYYVHTFDELSFGVKTAWRNSRRCIMRSQWSTIQTIDRRGVKTSEEMLEACFEHMRTATNGGRIKPTMTVFPQKFPGSPGPRIWNPQLIRYAGYKLKNGNIIGDPANVDITTRALELGWQPKFGRWDILPLIVNTDGGDPVWRDMPKDTILEVKMSHPTFDWFEELDLRWHDHPPVSYFCLSVGGINYTAVPFSGWYLGTEIACRNLADEHRYNALPEIGKRMGLPMNNRALWKDRAVMELNQAVLHSFDKAKVTLVDHHSASDSFVAHYEKEIKTRGHCPADWVWLTPPFSSGTTRIFHQEMYSYLVKPAILPFSEKPWETYWKGIGRLPAATLEEPAQHISTSNRSIRIAYATETGTAERHAQRLACFLRSRGQDVHKDLVELDDINLAALPTILLVVTSTFGEGDSPSGAHMFARRLARSADDSLSQSETRFSVFGFGNSTYAKTYQKFPQTVDAGLGRLGARRIVSLGQGDDAGDDATDIFNAWMTTVAVAIEVGTESVAVSTVSLEDRTVFSFASQIKVLESFVDYQVVSGWVLFDDGREGEAHGHRATYHLELARSQGGNIDYLAGDHISLLPASDVESVSLAMHFLGTSGHETVYGLSIEEIVTHYIDFTAPASQALLLLAGTVSGSSTLEALSHVDTSAVSVESIIRALPLKVPRYFSIASTPLLHPNSVHLTVAHLFGGRVSSALAEAASTTGLPRFEMKGKIRHSKFQLPVDGLAPLIFIATGTGIAPIRGMLYERTAKPVVKGFGKILCLFGFRSPKEHLYASESIFARSHNVTTDVAYSRGSNPKRVDDLVRSHACTVVDRLEEGASVFICGSHAMKKAVEESIVKAVECVKKMDAEGARLYITRLKRDGRILSNTYTHISAHLAVSV